jgi:hypothetical protein
MEALGEPYHPLYYATRASLCEHRRLYEEGLRFVEQGLALGRSVKLLVQIKFARAV